jgi:hypothetical protein
MESIFSTYSQGENRVTSTMLAVFERLSSYTLTSILQILLDDSTIELMKFTNQVKLGKAKSVPDAEIKGMFRYLVETKIKVNSVVKKQIEEHLNSLPEIQSIDTKLIVITPDEECPQILSDIREKDNRLYFTNFFTLLEAINKVLEQNYLINEREVYLLTELKLFIETEDGLLPDDYSQKVVIIPASKIAKDDYSKYKLYICQPNRSFQKSNYLGLYFDKCIFREVPKILAIIENIDIKNTKLSVNDIVMIDENFDRNYILERFTNFQKEFQGSGGANKVIFLSKNELEGTIMLKQDIKNNKRSFSNKVTAFIQKQRYTSLDRLQKAEYKSDLE